MSPRPNEFFPGPVWTAYVDESRRGEGSVAGDWYFVTGLAVRQDVQAEANAAIAGVVAGSVAEHGLHGEVEIHGSELFGGRGCFEGVEPWIRVQLGVRALRALSDFDPVVFLAGVDVDGLRERYPTPFPPHQLCMQFLLERLNEWIAGTRAEPGHERDWATIVADDHHLRGALVQDLEEFNQRGTWGYRGTKIEFVRGMQFRASIDSPMLQMADLVSFMLQRRHHVPRERDRRVERGINDHLRVIEPWVASRYLWRPSPGRTD
jgi:Protein of unknown function (DUF3800)